MNLRYRRRLHWKPYRHSVNKMRNPTHSLQISNVSLQTIVCTKKKCLVKCVRSWKNFYERLKTGLGKTILFLHKSTFKAC